jgi:hypothetical protein
MSSHDSFVLMQRWLKLVLDELWILAVLGVSILLSSRVEEAQF